MIYVLKEWRVARKADVHGNYVHIAGRKGGFFAWVCSLLGIEPTFTLDISPNNAVLRESSMKGFEKKIIPTTRIGGTACAFRWAFYTFVISFLVACFFLPIVFLSFRHSDYLTFLCTGVFVVVALIQCVYSFFFERYLSVTVSGFGVNSIEIRFRPSFIEGQSVNTKSAEEACDIIQMIVDIKASNPKAGSIVAPPPAV